MTLRLPTFSKSTDWILFNPSNVIDSTGLYNSNVSIYNQLLVTFPTSSIAKSKGMTKKDFFEAEDIKKEDVKIDL